MGHTVCRFARVSFTFTWLVAFVLFLSFVQGCSSDDATPSTPVVVPPGQPPTPAAQGILRVQIVGLPAGEEAAVVVTGAGGFERTLTASADLPVPAGEVNVVAKGVADKIKKDGSGFRPADGSQTIAVPADAGATAVVAYEPVAPKIAAEAKVASVETAAAVTALTRDDAGNATLTFAQANAETQGWKVGDLIVFGATPTTPEGFLGRVATTDGKTVTTSPAAIQELIEEGVIDFSRTFGPEDITKIVPLQAFAPNIRLCGSLTRGLSVGSGASNVALTFGGDICVAPKIDMNLTFVPFNLPNVYFRGSAGITGSLFVEGTATIGIQREIPLYQWVLGTINLQLGVVPVVITPTLVISIGGQGQITAGVRAGITYGLYPSGGFFFDGKTRRFTPFAGQTHEWGYQKPEPVASASLKGYVGVNLDVLVYAVAGPYVGIEGYTRFDVNLASTPAWELHAGLELKAGVTTNRIFKIDLSASLLNLDWVLLRATDKMPNGSKLSVSAAHATAVSPVLGPSNLVYVGVDNQIRAVPTVGPAVWTYTMASPAWQLLKAADGDLYASDFDGYVYALSPSGVERWKTLFAPGAALATAAASTLYVGAGSNVRALATANGNPSWTTDVGTQVRGLAVAKDGTIYVTTMDGLVALTPAGALKWTVPPDIGSTAAPNAAIGPDGTVYVAVSEAGVKLAAVNPDGTVKFRQTVLLSDEVSSPVVGPDWTIYMCGTNPDPSLVAIWPTTGATKWRYRHGELCKGPPAIGEDKNIYLMTDVAMRAITPSMGTVSWRTAAPPIGTGMAPTGSPLFLSTGDVAAVNSGGLWVFASATQLSSTGWPRAGGGASGAGAAK